MGRGNWRPAPLAVVGIALLAGMAWPVAPASADDVIVVGTNATSGPGSLSEAITQANADPDLDTIRFSSAFTIDYSSLPPAASLPSIDQPVLLDGCVGGSRVEINGLPTPVAVQAPGTTVQGLRIAGNRTAAAVTVPTSDVRLRSLDVDGVASATFFNGRAGIAVGPLNQVSTLSGVHIGDAEPCGPLTVRNIVGGGVLGTITAAISFYRVVDSSLTGTILGGTSRTTAVGAGFNMSNVRMRNSDGVRISGNWFKDNPIGFANVQIEESGTEAKPTLVTGNVFASDAPGLAVLGGHARIGGTAAGEGNVVARGGRIVVGTDRAEVTGNIIGFGPSGEPGTITATGIAAVGRPVPAGPGPIGHAVITDNLVANCQGHGISVATRGGLVPIGGVVVVATIQRNRIGTDATGAADAGCAMHGMWVDQGHVTVGGEPADGNLISGNGGDGVHASRGSSLTVTGNRIGTNAAGTAALPNDGDGVEVEQVFGSTVANNQISGNGGEGVLMRGPRGTISRNLIGTAPDGVTPLGNAGAGVVADAASVVVGTPLASADPFTGGNVIGANRGGSNVLIGTVVRGNWIGVGADGATPLPHLLDGVHALGSGVRVLDNQIGASPRYAIALQGADAVVQSNRIGVDADGQRARRVRRHRGEPGGDRRPRRRPGQRDHWRHPVLHAGRASTGQPGWRCRG